ncbi:ankyrin repeat-containing domain protein [Baffinella frigidus]|nr:ankyrin repeat-containing domain protein [Cryptophyta sp. CCMP2293]
MGETWKPPTALWLASARGQEAEVLQLLEGGAELDEEGGPYTTATMHAAIYHGHEGVVSLLLERGADASATDTDGKTRLHWACLQDRVLFSRLLLDHGADPSAKDNQGVSPLHWAACEGRGDVVRLLLDRGADVSAKTTEGSTPEQFASARNQHQIAAMLRAEVLRRAQCEAFAMGQHSRLGAGSWVQDLEAGVVRMVLELV